MVGCKIDGVHFKAFVHPEKNPIVQFTVSKLQVLEKRDDIQQISYSLKK